MSAALRIAGDEWRLWYRSRRVVVGLAAFILLLGSAAALTAVRLSVEKHRRLALQTHADDSFATQPDRHPHRMVHYGHYVFRPPAPFAIFDPGVDAVTGEAIFLEGHRQNAATFADERAGANVGGFGRLTPALLYQVFLPLLLIALGHGAIIRERENGTLATLLAQGTTARALMMGKVLALAGLVAVMLVPAAIAVGVAVADGEDAIIATAIVLSYAAYLLIWAGIIVAASLLCRERAMALGTLLVTWLTWTLVVPPLAVAVTSARHPTPSKLESDLRMQAAIRASGDGHNASDPAFARLRAQLLAKYDVDRVEDLPVNIRGVVAEASEAKLTDILNTYADGRMDREAEQARGMMSFGWLSPTVAIAAASRTLAGTDLATHHRFLREAESLRFEFVQRLNRIHAEQLAFSDDVRRSSDAEAERRTRVSKNNWSLLSAFRFSRADPADRASATRSFWAMLAAWMVAIVVACATGARRLSP